MNILKYWKETVILAAFVIVSALSYKIGTDRIQSKWDKERTETAKDALKQERAINAYKQQLQDATAKLDATIAVSQAETKTHYETVTKEVIKYVQKDNPPASVIDNDWLSIYNASISRPNKN